MSKEHTVYVRLSCDAGRQAMQLKMSAEDAARRSQKLPPGDRRELVRIEYLQTAVEQLAVAALAGGAETASTDADCWTALMPIMESEGLVNDVPELVGSWLEAGSVVAWIRRPHLVGETAIGGKAGTGPVPPCRRWLADRNQGPPGQQRFEDLIGEAIASNGTTGKGICPSNIPNAVLTETLRKYVDDRGHAQVDVPVNYADGSKAPAFALRSLALRKKAEKGRRKLRFALMSIRHVEMDAIVDGAWFRNSQISLPRPAGMTDAIAFDLTKQQLRALDPGIPTTLHLYQTGFETAIMGFYRGLVCHLLEFPGSVSVVPQYYGRHNRFREGTVWATA